jgi:alpha-L-rhamnosidase
MNRFYGDIRILEEHYDSLKKYVDFLSSMAEGHIQKRLGKYGDWCPPGSVVPKKTPIEFTSTWFYLHDVLFLARAAGILKREEDRKHYSDLARAITAAFHETFWEEDQYRVRRISPIDKSSDQTAHALALALDLAPPGKRADVLARLVHNVIDDQDGHLDTGILGTRYLLDVLTENGHGETAYRIVDQRTYPGWGYMVENGATTLWERWEKITGGGMNSHNHIMFGSVDAWFYKALAGLFPLAGGWKRFRVRPLVVRDLRFVTASLDTVVGPICVSWEKRDPGLVLLVSVPVNARAEIHFPADPAQDEIFEGKQAVWKPGNQVKESPEWKILKPDDGYMVLDIGSGDYAFSVRKGEWAKSG